jgi:hypothetical protein
VDPVDIPVVVDPVDPALEDSVEVRLEEVVVVDSEVVMVDSEEEMVDLLEDKSSDTSTSTLPQMKHQAPKPEPSEFQEETSTLTSSSLRPHLPHLPNKPKSSFQNKTNRRTWSTFCSRREKLPQMSRSDDQLPQLNRSQRSTSSDMEMVLELEVLVETEDPDLEEVHPEVDSEVDPDSVEELKPSELHPLLMESTKLANSILAQLLLYNLINLKLKLL